MDTDANWYRQLAALVLLSASRAAVEFITNPGSRQDATKQLKGAFAEIDYEALASALTRTIDSVASTSKSTLDETIDSLRDRSVDAVQDARSKAEKQLGQKKGGRKMKFFFGLLIGGIIAYFILDEQRRDDMLDRLTGASGPIEQNASSYMNQASSSAQSAVNSAQDTAQNAAQTATESAADVTSQANEAAQTAAKKAKDSDTK